MGSFTSRYGGAHSGVAPKQLEVLPATASWSTLDAFQATVKKDEHHELINRTKTQKSIMIRRKSLHMNNYKRRTKTLNAIPADSAPILEENKDLVAMHTKMQATSSPARFLTEEKGSSTLSLYSEFSQSRANARRGTHFYEVRQAMVNRKPIKKLDSIASVSVTHLDDQTINTSAPNLKAIKESNEMSLADKPVAVANAANEPKAAASLSTSSFNKSAEPAVLTNKQSVAESPQTPEVKELPNKESNDVKHLKVANLSDSTSKSAVQLECVSHSGINDSCSIFKVDPAPHAAFAPDPAPSEREIECRVTVKRLAVLSSEESTREEVEKTMQKLEKSGQLANIEKHALTIPQSQTTTIEGLASSLVNSSAGYIKAAEADENVLYIQIAQAYCIYAWIANNIVYDVEQLKPCQSRDACSTDPEEVLHAGLTVCTGYANLFKALALAAGLKADTVHGHVKQWKYLSKEGQNTDIPFKPSSDTSHTWNTVMIGGIPHLLDCTFASGYVTSSKTFHKSYSHHYFAVAPQQMILTHWPSDDSCQLLKEPLTLDNFKPLIPMSQNTKGLGIEPECWSEVIETMDDPVACIVLRCKDGVSVTATLTTANESETRNGTTACHGTQQKYTFVYREGNEVRIRAIPPHIGQFFLNIYAHQSLEMGSDQSHHLVLSYLLQNKREIKNQVGYPIVTGADSSTHKFELQYWNAPNRDYCCENSGKLEIVFKACPDLQFYHCITPDQPANSAAIPGATQAGNSHQFNTLVAQNEGGDPSLYVMHAIFPTQGWWTLHLYAKKPGYDSFESSQTGYVLVLTYSVFVQVGLPEQSYPNILSPYISMLQPESISASGDEIFSFYFNSSKTFDFHCYLTFDVQTGESMDNFTAIETATGSNQHKLSVIFPKSGTWYAHVFGKDVNDPLQKSYLGLFVLQLKVNSSLNNTVFPKLNQSLANALNVTYLNSGSVTFRDDGTPFDYEILVPKGGGIDLAHCIKPHNPGLTSTTFDEDLLQHCSLLSFSPHVDDPESLSVCSLKAVFPWAGKWTVQLFAASPGSKRYMSLVEVTFPVKIPTPSVCYVKLHPSFHHLSLNIPEKFLSYNPKMDASEIEVPFKAPEDVQFVWNMEFVETGEKFFQQAYVHSQEESQFSVHDCNRILHVIFPKPGDWIFHLYGKESSDQQKHSYRSVMEIRVNVSSFNNELGFPHIFDPFRKEFGMKLEKENLPFVTKVTSFPTKISIPFHSLPNVKLWHDIESDQSSNAHPTSHLCQDLSSGQHELEIEIDYVGKWTVILYAQLTETEKKNWTAVLKHTISSESK